RPRTGEASRGETCYPTPRTLSCLRSLRADNGLQEEARGVNIRGDHDPGNGRACRGSSRLTPPLVALYQGGAPFRAEAAPRGGHGEWSGMADKRLDVCCAHP